MRIHYPKPCPPVVIVAPKSEPRLTPEETIDRLDRRLKGALRALENARAERDQARRHAARWKALAKSLWLKRSRSSVRGWWRL